MVRSSSSPDCKGVAIVTGCARGIGKAIALRLAQDGYDIGLNDLSDMTQELETVAKEIEAKGRRAVVVTGDVSVEADVNGMVEGTIERLGGLDVMVANAAMSRVGAVAELDAKVWDAIISVNLRGSFLCYKHAAAQMIKQGRGGRIVGASAMAGQQGQPFLSAYSVSKFGVRGLTQSAAKELGRYGITVNCYAPGVIDTPMFREFEKVSGDPAFVEQASHSLSVVIAPFVVLIMLRQQLTKSSAVGHIGEPEDVANIVAFLVSKEARFITAYREWRDAFELKVTVFVDQGDGKSAK